MRDLLLEHDEVDASLVQRLDQLDEVVQRSSQPVEASDDQLIALSEVRERVD